MSTVEHGLMRTQLGWYSFLDPQVEDVRMEDIIYGMKRILRFAGHSNVTLADHSLRVFDICRWELGSSIEKVQRTALLHDAHEVYVGDVSNPLKTAMRTAVHDSGALTSVYDDIENINAEVVAERFDLIYPHPEIVKKADLMARSVEVDLTWGVGEAERWGLEPPPRATMRRKYASPEKLFRQALEISGVPV